MRYYILLCVLFIVAQGYSQKGIIYYGQIKSPGMRSAVGPDLNAYLVFDKEKSYYVTAKDSLEIVLQDRSVYQGDEGQVVAVSTGNNTFRYGEQVFYNRTKDSLWWSQRFRGNIYIAEKKPEIEWNLESESKTIGGLTAHKATGEFRGRTYTAWYTTELPLPYGPWKLQGLPGVILEAKDEKDEMLFYFKSLEYPTKNTTQITQVKREKGDAEDWLTIADFEKLLRNSLIRAYNNMVLSAEESNSKKPEKPVFRDIYIESFEE